MKKGLIHVYTGNGKGKTTAAMGLCLRALGNGLSVAVFQFCKATPTGEHAALTKMGVRFERAQVNIHKFPWDMDASERAQYREAQTELFELACEAACEGQYDLIVLDEIMAAQREQSLALEQLLYLLAHRNAGTELVLTGRDAPEKLLEAADYVTEMRAVRHPMDMGTHARKGIEF